jgi:hypothetical protein
MSPLLWYGLETARNSWAGAGLFDLPRSYVRKAERSSSQLNYRPVLSSERVPYMKKKESNCHRKKCNIWSLAPKGAPSRTGRLTVGRNITWTWATGRAPDSTGWNKTWQLRKMERALWVRIQDSGFQCPIQNSAFISHAITWSWQYYILHLYENRLLYNTYCT